MTDAAAALQHITFARQQLGANIPDGARVLDFGCGIGQSVTALLDLDFDAYGVDITAFWGQDFGQYWNDANPPSPQVRHRLFIAESEPYRLPFSDQHFDFCFSDTVMEHVTDHAAVFREIARVLKPNAISVHRFPGPFRPMEEHLMVPAPWLCGSRTYLAICALLGFRNKFQTGLSWRETTNRNATFMAVTRYPTKRQLQATAKAAGVAVAFDEAREFRFRRRGLKARLLSHAGPLLQRYMILRRQNVTS